MNKLQRNVLAIAVGWGVVTFVSFITLTLYNTWSPGCAFECYREDTDVFESNLIATWFVLGVVVTVALGVIFFALREFKVGDKHD